jgi:hypothetical protein
MSHNDSTILARTTRYGAMATTHSENVKNPEVYLSEDEEAAQERGFLSYLKVSRRIREMDVTALPEFLAFYPKLAREGAAAQSIRLRIQTLYLFYGRTVFFQALRATDKTTQESILSLLRENFKDVPKKL